MRKIGSLLDRRKLARKNIDQETVFYVFRQIIKDEYGRQGAANIVPVFFRDRKVSVKTNNQNWANEVELNKKMIVKKINQQLGEEEVADLSMAS